MLEPPLTDNFTITLQVPTPAIVALPVSASKATTSAASVPIIVGSTSSVAGSSSRSLPFNSEPEVVLLKTIVLSAIPKYTPVEWSLSWSWYTAQASILHGFSMGSLVSLLKVFPSPVVPEASVILYLSVTALFAASARSISLLSLIWRRPSTRLMVGSAILWTQ